VTERARESFLVLRLWAEPGDARVRGRLLVQAAEEPGRPLLGVDSILGAVEQAVRAFAEGELGPWRGGPDDAPTTPPRRAR
jgi:hypothetical protein